MRISLVLLVIVLLVFIYGDGTHAQVNTTNTFTTTLVLGSRGTQVVALQQILNRDPDTRIANTGPGSPGNETSYFGPLTKNAVIRFQEKYANEVLVPVGLVGGNGYVGSYTRAKLNSLSISISSSVVTPNASTTVSQNPNLKNLDALLVAIDTVATKKGFSTSDIATMKNAVIANAATTTDLQAAFVKIVEKNAQKTASVTSFPNTILTTIADGFRALLLPRYTRAAGLPFGGPLGGATYCTCSFTWLINIGPLPPTYVTLLDYIPGSQAYLSYNIPGTSWLLGEYGGGDACYMRYGKYCILISSEGIITPTVGSSPS